MKDWPAWGRSVGIRALALALLAFVAGMNCLSGGFTFDDEFIVRDNPVVTGSGGLGRIWTSHYWAGEEASGDLYRPLTVSTYWLIHRVFGQSPWAHHLANLILHASVTGLLYLLFVSLSGSGGIAIVGALLFAVHPVHTEAVASVVGRAELLAALFVIASWLTRSRRILSAVLFGLALLSKENAIVLPALLFGEDLMSGQRSRTLTQVWKRYVPWLVALAGFALLRILLFGPTLGAVEGPFVGIPSWMRILTAIEIFGRYLSLMVWPATLSADYSFDQIPVVHSLLDPWFLIGLGLLLGCITALALARRRLPVAASGIGFFLVALAPVSNLFFPIGVSMAERLLYLPSAGLCLLAGALLGSRPRPRPMFLVAVITILLAWRGWVRAADWRDDLALFAATVSASPRSATAHLGLGAALQGAGRVEEAEAAYRRSLEINPNRGDTWYNLAVLEENAGRREEAIASYGQAVRHDPDDQRAHNNLGLILQAANRLDDAESAYRAACALLPARRDPHYNLATLLEARGKTAGAIGMYQEALRIDPADVRGLNNLGRLLLAQGRVKEAIEILGEAVRLNPEATIPMTNLAAAFLADGDARRAADLCRRILRSNAGDAMARAVLDRAERVLRDK